MTGKKKVEELSEHQLNEVTGAGADARVDPAKTMTAPTPEEAAAARCVNNLKQIGLASHSYG